MGGKCTVRISHGTHIPVVPSDMQHNDGGIFCEVIRCALNRRIDGGESGRFGATNGQRNTTQEKNDETMGQQGWIQDTAQF